MSFKRGIKDAFNGLPLAVKNRMVKALAKRYGYSDTLPDGSPNPQGKLGFVASRIAENVKNDAIEVEWMDDKLAVPRPPDIIMTTLTYIIGSLIAAVIVWRPVGRKEYDERTV